jgi:transcriptional regulator with XRE-family HTH domain
MIEQSTLRRLLDDRHMTVADLSRLSGISVRSLEAYSSGRRSFSEARTWMSVKVADALQIDVHDLL